METTEEGFEPSRDENLIALAGQRNTRLCDSVRKMGTAGIEPANSCEN